MKQFLHKRWHSIPVGIISALMVVCLVAGGALAAYNFLTAGLKVEVREAIAIGMFDTWDNLEPYGSDTEAVWEDKVVGEDIVGGTLGDVTIDLGVNSYGNPTIAITAKSDKYEGEGLAVGEWVVIPVNIRNGSSMPLSLSATVDPTTDPSGTGTALALEYLWRTNNVGETFMPGGTWEPLDGWSETISGYGGNSGSAKVGALVLFVRVRAPEDVVPGTYAYTVTLARG